MYWIHVSYWGHIRNTISYIQLTQLGTVSPHFWGWDPTTTANVTPVETRTVTSPVAPTWLFSRLHERFEHAILDMWGDSAGNDSVIPRVAPHEK